MQAHMYILIYSIIYIQIFDSLRNGYTLIDARNLYLHTKNFKNVLGGARGVRVIVVGNGQGDSSSNPGRD